MVATHLVFLAIITYMIGFPSWGFIIIMRISPGLAMNENWISVQHNTQCLSTMSWTYIGLLWTLPLSIRVLFTDFGLNSVTFCTIIWHLVS